jgi:hypothetical protein
MWKYDRTESASFRNIWANRGREPIFQFEECTLGAIKGVSVLKSGSTLEFHGIKYLSVFVTKKFNTLNMN